MHHLITYSSWYSILGAESRSRSRKIIEVPYRYRLCRVSFFGDAGRERDSRTTNQIYVRGRFRSSTHISCLFFSAITSSSFFLTLFCFVFFYSFSALGRTKIFCGWPRSPTCKALSSCGWPIPFSCLFGILYFFFLWFIISGVRFAFLFCLFRAHI